jgi:dehydrogenase/reductase SDR family member 4
LWNVNVKSTFFLIKECLPLLKEAGQGANVCIISSVTGKNPNFTIGIYGSTKAALDNMVIWMADELMSDGIRVTGMAPGLIATEFSTPLWKGNKDLRPEMCGQPEDIGNVVATICSKDGRFMNGEVYQVHGGFAKL